MIGLLRSPSFLDIFTYRLLKAVSCKYHVANLYCASDFWAHTVTDDGIRRILVDGLELRLGLQDD